MIFNKPSPELVGKHAFLSPSSPHWLNYDDQKLEARFFDYRSAQRGTDLHTWAHEAIRLGMRVHPDHSAIAAYVDDALNFGMVCEQMLVYSPNCFGTADTIGFYGGILRIHDLKTGKNTVSERQLYVYTALFCLEYGVDPYSIEWELRIYQHDEAKVYNPTPELIVSIMEKIKYADDYIEELKEARG